jgi:hypothetical protein
VPSSAERLLPAGDRVIVVSPGERERALTVVARDPLRVVSQLPLPRVVIPPLGRASSAQEVFAFYDEGSTSPVRLDDQRWLLESELSLSCGSSEDCDALGILAGPVLGNGTITDCAPDATRCEQPPAPMVQGTARRRVFYVLDAGSASIGEPLVLDVERGTPYDLWSRPFVTGGTLLDLHLDPPYRGVLATAPLLTAQFWLERYELDGAGALQAMPALNVPGYPIALLPDGSLLSVEASPVADATAELYHSRIRGAGVEVMAQRSLGARFGNAKVLAQMLLYVRLPSDSCAPATRLETYALDAELSPRGALELAGDGWRILGATDDETVVLATPDNRSFARVTIDEHGAPSLAGFATAPGHIESPIVVTAADAGLATPLTRGAVLGVSESAVLQVSP